jgi:hypothetical protein
VGHLFVEGKTDAQLIADMTGYTRNVDIRTADEIEFDTSSGTAFCGGNKLKIVALAQEAHANSDSNNIRFLVDSDFDLLFTTVFAVRGLTKTDFSNLPVACLHVGWFRGFCVKAFGFVVSDEMWSDFSTIIARSFLARYIAARDQTLASAPSLRPYITVRAGRIEFDEPSYLRRYFSVPADTAEKIGTEISDLCAWLNQDVRMTANTNDVFDLLYGVLRADRRIGGAFPQNGVVYAYLGAFDAEVTDQPRMKDLINWVVRFGA